MDYQEVRIHDIRLVKVLTEDKTPAERKDPFRKIKEQLIPVYQVSIILNKMTSGPMWSNLFMVNFLKKARGDSEYSDFKNEAFLDKDKIEIFYEQLKTFFEVCQEKGIVIRLVPPIYPADAFNKDSDEFVVNEFSELQRFGNQAENTIMSIEEYAVKGEPLYVKVEGLDEDGWNRPVELEALNTYPVEWRKLYVWNDMGIGSYNMVKDFTFKDNLKYVVYDRKEWILTKSSYVIKIYHAGTEFFLSGLRVQTDKTKRRALKDRVVMSPWAYNAIHYHNEEDAIKDAMHLSSFMIRLDGFETVLIKDEGFYEKTPMASLIL